MPDDTQEPTLDRMVAEGYVARKVNPAGYHLYNYTPKAQYEGVWNAWTLMARGLVLAPDGTVQSRPFPKFFNLHEHDGVRRPLLPAEPFVAYEKLDGSLIVLSTTADGQRMVTSRGSFDSQHARFAADLLAAWDALPPPGETWCFELVTPWNRVVVDYGGTTGLTLLARFDTATGREHALHSVYPQIPTARRFDAVADHEALTARLSALGPNEEGYVLRFASGIRAKAKGEEYKRLHKLLTGVTERTIWECLSAGTGMAAVLDRVPDEFHRWAQGVADDLGCQYEARLDEASATLDRIEGLPTRRAQAEALADDPSRSTVFCLLDGKDPAPGIWRNLKPGAGHAFAADADRVAS